MLKPAAWRGPGNFFASSRDVNEVKLGNPAPAQV